MRLTETKLLASAAIAVLAAAACPARDTVLDLQRGDLRFTAATGSDLRLEWRGVPVFREMGLFIIQPGWTAVYLYQDGKAATRVTRLSETDGEAAWETENAFARYRFTLGEEEFRVRVTFGSPAPAPVTAQVRAYLNANLFGGASWKARDGRTGRIPAAALPSSDNRLIERFDDVTLETPLGRVRVTLEGDAGPFALDDQRAGEAEWARKNPMMWLGANVDGFPSPEGRTVTWTFRFEPRAIPSALDEARVKVRVRPTRRARVPWTPEKPLIPRPKRVAFGDEAKVRAFAGPVAVVVPEGACAEEKEAAREVAEELVRWWGTPAAVHVRNLRTWRPAPGRAAIVLSRRSEIGRDLAKEMDWPVEGGPEAYSLSTLGRVAVVRGEGRRGVYNGAQTLKQLLRADGRGVSLRPALIRDWPTLSLRGVHWFGGRNSAPFHRRMLEDVLGPFKLNTMLYEVDYADWDALESHDAARGMSKADVRATVDLARRKFIEPVPVLETFGNSDWLFVNGQNQDIRWKGRERSYDPNNPESFRRLFRVFEEAIEIFRPRYFHIGHDEMTVGENAIPPPGESRSAVDLIAESVEKLGGWLRQRGLTPMMWGDTALRYPEEAADAGTAKSLNDARALRARLPRDVVIADWHYEGETTEYPSIATFQGLGHKVVGATWFDRGNIRNFARALAREKSLGLVQTTWAGWVMDEASVKGPLAYQFVVYPLAAEHAWNGGAHSPEDLGWEPEEVFARAWDRKPADLSVLPGFTAGFGAKDAGTRRVGGIEMAYGDPITLAGGLETVARPASARFDLGERTAARLHFLWHATAATDVGTPVATLEVTYRDGAVERVPILYGRQVFAPGDQRSGPETVVVHNAKGDRGLVSRRLWAWRNPHPEAPIESVVLVSGVSEAALVISGLTGES